MHKCNINFQKHSKKNSEEKCSVHSTPKRFQIQWEERGAHDENAMQKEHFNMNKDNH